MNSYVEVFAGGGALYFLPPQPAPVDVLNDINGDLVTLYRVLHNHLEEFVRQFKWTSAPGRYSSGKK